LKPPQEYPQAALEPGQGAAGEFSKGPMKHLRLAKSIFGVGLGFIRQALFSITHSLEIALRLFIQFIDLKQYYKTE
jgi:hypothetical protein